MRLFLTFAVVAAATAAQAQALDTLQMSCGQARSTVARAGAVVLHSGPHIFDRYVAATNFCQTGEVMRPAFAPTRDAAVCPVGNLCITPDNQRIFRGN